MLVNPPQWGERRERIRNYCRDHQLELPKPRQLNIENISGQLRQHFTNIYHKDLMTNIVHIPSLNLNWCLVPKVASTSISSLILPYLRTLSDQRSFPHIQKEVWTRAGHLQYSQYILHQNSTPAFLITRHPFARVASAFRNKLEDRSKSHDGEYFYNTYSRQIIKFSRGSWTLGDREPTFPEFIHFLIHTDVHKYDEHWQPVAIRCRYNSLP